MCHYQKGTKNEVAFVFSCPGAAEEAANKPAAGRTGTNLHQLLTILSQEYGDNIEWSREAITITNAWSQVEYRELTGRTEATVREVLTEENLTRLEAELRPVKKLIITSGGRAALVVKALQSAGTIDDKVKVLQIRHLGLRALNQIKVDVRGEPILSVADQLAKDHSLSSPQAGRENTMKRLKVVAAEIGNKLRK
ncbi:hypothetical protein RYX45_14545 [Alkalihalophilus pseudofirmus]|uniref:Uncharacterized protein n=1 Tax=Alkalihalophilus pseudofirmus TaxID=79885 RepID=A0AAJ2NQ51_ALKPS|nr:hypothetical protein [Alkalihalophilus pseudofirmus]MDV2886406.1 hypothetical protein [Alkalihalophilus pseudofirmus]